MLRDSCTIRESAASRYLGFFIPNAGRSGRRLAFPKNGEVNDHSAKHFIKELEQNPPVENKKKHTQSREDKRVDKRKLAASSNDISKSAKRKKGKAKKGKKAKSIFA